MWREKNEGKLKWNHKNEWSNSFEHDSHWGQTKTDALCLLEMDWLWIPVMEQDIKMYIQSIYRWSFYFPFRLLSAPVWRFFFLVLMSSFDSANVRCILHIRLSTSCYGSDPERPLYFHYKNESVIKICKHIKQWYLECLNIIMCAHVNVQLLEATIATCNIPTAPLNIRNASESKCRWVTKLETIHCFFI